MCVTQPNGENNTNVMFRFAQSSVASTSAGVWSMFGPTGASNYILDGHSADTSSTSMTNHLTGGPPVSSPASASLQTIRCI